MTKWTNTYYENHKEDTVKDYLDRTRERRLDYGKEYYKKNKRERLKYYQENRDKRLEYQRKYDKKRKNPKGYFKDTLMELLEIESRK